MRLIKVPEAPQTSHTLILEEFYGRDGIPPYAILSHTWGKDEVVFADLQHGSYMSKRGYDKIHHAMMQARKEGYLCIWIDICCIDKSRSAELSEAINSMFEWYKAAAKCYAYLEDVAPGAMYAHAQRK